MKLWSVELEANSWNDDTFNGTYEECFRWCAEHDYVIGSGCRLACIEIDECGCVIDCFEILDEL